MTPIVAPSAPDTLAAPRIATEILAAQKAAPTLPPWAPRGPLLSALQPRSASAQKKLVDGLPTRITVKPSSTGLNPNVSSSGDIVQATLSVLNKTKTDDVIAYYKSQLAKAGLAGSQSPSQGGGNRDVSVYARWRQHHPHGVANHIGRFPLHAVQGLERVRLAMGRNRINALFSQ